MSALLGISRDCLDFDFLEVREVVNFGQVNKAIRSLVKEYLIRITESSPNDENIFKRIKTVDWLITNSSKIYLQPSLRIIDDNGKLVEIFINESSIKSVVLIDLARYFSKRNFLNCLKQIILKLQTLEIKREVLCQLYHILVKHHTEHLQFFLSDKYLKHKCMYYYVINLAFVAKNFESFKLIYNKSVYLHPDWILRKILETDNYDFLDFFLCHCLVQGFVCDFDKIILEASKSDYWSKYTDNIRFEAKRIGFQLDGAET